MMAYSMPQLTGDKKKDRLNKKQDAINKKQDGSQNTDSLAEDCEDE
jgi:hypothetical protein